MNFEIRVLTCSQEKLEAELNQPASQGWQLVSCWPEKQGVLAVFQRPKVASSEQTTGGSQEAEFQAEPPKAVHLPDLDDVLAACRVQPERKSDKGKTYRQALAVAKFAKDCGMEEAALLDYLDALGIKQKNGKSKDLWHDNHFISLVRLKNDKLYLSITHAPPKKGKK